MTEIKLENIDGHPVALAVENGQIIARRLDDFAAPREKTGFFGFSDLDDFFKFVGEQGSLGTSLWILPEPTDGIVLTAIIDGHTHYHPGRLAFRANYFADDLPEWDEDAILDFCQEHQFPLYRGVPAEPVAEPVVEEGSTIAAGCEEEPHEFSESVKKAFPFTSKLSKDELDGLLTIMGVIRDYIDELPDDWESARMKLRDDFDMTIDIVDAITNRTEQSSQAQPAAKPERPFGMEEAQEESLKAMDDHARRVEELERRRRQEADTDWACAMADI